MTQYSRLTTNLRTQQVCFGSYGVPDEVERHVTALINKTGDGSPPSTSMMLKRADQIGTEYSTFLCAQYAQAAVITNSPCPYEKARYAFHTAWTIGVDALMRSKQARLNYSASQGNASLLNAGVGLAKYKVSQSDLAGALKLANVVIVIDAEDSCDARLVKAHIEQLMGDKLALDSLRKVASSKHPKAYYALGLEYLRVDRAYDAAVAFSQAIHGAPEVAEILLSMENKRSDNMKINQLAAEQYVETFCLPEWTSSELDALAKVASKHRLAKI